MIPSEEVRYYERSAVRTFLEQAEAARLQLERALDDAHRRRATAEAELDHLLRSQARVAVTTRSATIGLQAEREVTWDLVASVIAEAEARADGILAEAKAQLLAVREAGCPANPSSVSSLHPRPVSTDRWGREAPGPVHAARLLAG